MLKLKYFDELSGVQALESWYRYLCCLYKDLWSKTMQKLVNSLNGLILPIIRMVTVLHFPPEVFISKFFSVRPFFTLKINVGLYQTGPFQSLSFQISPSEAKILLQVSCWSVDESIKKRNSKILGAASTAAAATTAVTSTSQQLPQNSSSSSTPSKLPTTFCDVCAVSQPSIDFSNLPCRHLFCKGCWEMHFECQILQGISTSKRHPFYPNSP